MRPLTAAMSLYLLLVVLAASWARASEPSVGEGWVVQHWMPENGLPLNHLTGLVQTPDGMLWMTTLDGLVRYDGVRFLTFRPSDLPGLPSSRLSSIEQDAAGALWIVTEQGALVRLKDGLARSWSVSELGSEARVVMSQAGQVWVICSQGLLRVEGERLVPFGDPGVREANPGILEDMAVAPDGGLWVVGRDALLRLDAEGALKRRYGRESGAELSMLVTVNPSPAGEVLVVERTSLLRVSGERLVPVPTHGAPLTGLLCATIDEGEGVYTIVGQTSAWRLEPDGALTRLGDTTMEACLDARSRRDQGRWRLRATELVLDGAPVLQTAWPVRSVLPTEEGVWVITTGDGLYLLRQAPVRMLAPATAAGGVIVGPSGERYSLQQNGLVHLSDPPRSIRLGTVELRPGGLMAVDSLAADSLGQMWGGGRLGMCRIEDDQCRYIQIEGTIAARPMAVDGRGALWVDTELGVGKAPAGEGPDEGWELVQAHDPAVRVRTATSLQDGSVVAAFEYQDLRRFRDREITTWTPEDAPGLDKVRSLYADPEGVLWIGTVDGGLCSLDFRPSSAASRPTPRCLTRSRGMPAETIHSVTGDDQGRLWMSSNQGIFYVLRSEALAALDDPALGLSPLLLSERDGLASREANGLGSTNVGRAADGTLLFPTQGGIAQLDPGLFPIPAPPEVRIDHVSVNGHPVSKNGHLELSPAQRDVSFAWTAPEFRWPDQLLFRYRLVGYADAWSPLSGARTASWTNLPPGDYRLEVQAVLGGSWSREPASLAFTRAPAFAETPWFLACVLAAILGLVGGLAWWRGRLRQARILALEAEVQRRTAVLYQQNAALAQSNQTVAEQAARLAELDTLKSTFVSNLSHELRTPLTLVLGPLDELLDRPEGLDDHQRSTVRIAHRNAERLRELVGQLFDVARLETGGLPLRARPRDLGALARRVAERFLGAAAERGVRLETLAPEELVVWVDADLIDKVLSNLLGNALRFTPAGGRVSVRVELSGELEARVTVTDTGAGVPAAEQAHIFERFYQVNPAGSQAHGGAGIGLSLARDLVELHGGAMWVESAPGEGSTFRFTLPLGVQHLRPEEVDLNASMPDVPYVEAPRVASASLEPRVPPPSDAGEAEARPRASVLIVEDHADMRAYIASHLAERFTVRTAEDGLAALTAIRAQRPDVVVSDVMMPGLDGIALCREIRADPALAELPVILVSAKGAESDRRAGLKLASAWFSKPFRMRELVEQVARLAPPPPPVAAAPLDAPPSEADRRFLARLHAEVRASLADPDLSVVKLARVMAMSRRQLLREVSRLTGQPVVAFVQRLRMEAARDLLRQERDLPVSEVASAVGMNRAYFSRLYSAWYGHPPSAERAAAPEP